MDDLSPHTGPDDQESVVLKRRQRQRNVALLWVLLGLVVLFFAITIVQLSRAGHP